MVFAVDAGNTNIVIGTLSKQGEIYFTSRIATNSSMTGDQYAVLIKNILNLYKINPDSISGSIISTVVPALKESLSIAIKLLFGAPPMVVGQGIDLGLKVSGIPAEAIGADLICAAVGALKKYPAPMIIFDFGTATTITAIDSEGVFLGGSIVPGAKISLNALCKSAALLKDIDLFSTDSLSPISLDTSLCMKSGIVLGSASMMDGMIQRCRKKIGENAVVIATGGLAGTIVPHCVTPGIILDRDLLLHGLLEIYLRNKIYDE